MSHRCNADVPFMSQATSILLLDNLIEGGQRLHHQRGPTMNDKHNHRCTFGTNFLITIHHQENHSWQGVVQWLDTGKTVHFRSELELINLIHGAVQLNTATDETLRTWNDERRINAV